MKRFTFFLITFVALTFFATLSRVSAQDSFDVNSYVTYEVEVSGNTHVSHVVTLENLRSDTYAESFRLNLNSTDPYSIEAYEGEEELDIDIKTSEKGTIVDVIFDESVVGLGEFREFRVEYDDASLAEHTGEVWEISIPRLKELDTFNSYDVELLVPVSLGNEAYISPSPRSSQLLGDMNLYIFDKNSVVKSGITAGFGQLQVFSFSVSYHLENPLNKKTTISIALPPDSSIQRMHYSEISPEPLEITLDSDGNWMAEYELEPRQRLDVNAKGSVEIFSEPRPYLTVSPDTLEANLAATEFWQVDDPEIVALAKSLGTPEAIYDYVVNTLSYDYERVRPNVNRLGAKEALEFPTMAICMEFTDLFIALSRAAGIPSREINGFAYTENPEIEPLSLVADVLHAWPEYWNEDTKTWIPVDPTWGSTTGGVDYFNKLDLRHFTFVIHGASDREPFPPGSYKLGPNPQKDVYVNFGQLPTQRINDLKVSATRTTTMPYFGGNVIVKIENPGPRAEYNLTPKIGYGGTTLENKFVEVMPPFSTYTFKTPIPYNFLGTNTPDSIIITVKNISLEVPTFKSAQVILNLTVTLIILLVMILMLLYKTGKIKFVFVKRAVKKLKS